MNPVLPRWAGIRPAEVRRCATAGEVVAALDASPGRVAVRSGGHCFAGRSSTTGLLIDVSTPLAEVYDTLAAHGRTIAAGCGPTIGIAGLTLGGGAPGVVTAPPDPSRPLVVSVFGAAPSPASVDGLIGRLSRSPVTDARAHGSHRRTKRWLAGADEPDDRHAYLRSEYFRTTVPATDLVARLLDGRRPGEQRELDFSPWGGAYPNFPEPGLPAEAYFLDNTARVRQLRARYDPAGRFAS